MIHFKYSIRPVQLFIFQLIFFILMWFRSVFEADLHTDPKTKIYFVCLNGFHVMRWFPTPLSKKINFSRLEGAAFKIDLKQ